MSDTTPDLSLIVLGYRNFQRHTQRCLESLLPWEADPRFEFLVIDNGSPDDSAAQTQAWCGKHDKFRAIPSDCNLGFAGGMNLGAQQARGRWLLLVNNDTLFPAGALDALHRVLQDAEGDVAMIGPVTNAAGNGQRLWLPDRNEHELLNIGVQLMTNPTGILIPTYRTDFFCVAIRADTWRQLGGLDTGFGLGYYEDFDFSLRLSQAGYRQMITEDVFIVHTGSASFQGSKEAKALLKRNKALLKSRHPDVRFEHVREGNLAVLEAYHHLVAEQRWSTELQARQCLRLPALKAEAPRSFLKRLMWKQRCRAFGKETNHTPRSFFPAE